MEPRYTLLLFSSTVAMLTMSGAVSLLFAVYAGRKTLNFAMVEAIIMACWIASGLSIILSSLVFYAIFRYWALFIYHHNAVDETTGFILVTDIVAVGLFFTFVATSFYLLKNGI